ncbi:alanine--glyoxylate aminotransferase 2, mitochondrial isoform X1 [Acyrthosiphon pisum]|uniref:Alanine--glyoxylate aminotransferase 2, mitochondrial n=2 Tax=Acyrthosiphon pisum TaxID=7029 RepID=A0A8R2A9S2_ACYPI|nr:alanine--glyoxylate aminotransferase 2, mitochondrial isoform X1 [Acyrthosiphon pisum]|eukprot:XP_001947837.2 PREDICTED: alanine--glyoxylate aminotransferase 2, mitochondrial isoform X1 [Acyrthosiphon pisum]
MKNIRNKFKGINKHYTTSRLYPKLPPIDFKPLPYKGVSYEKAQSMQLDNVFPQVQMYEEPLLLHEGKMQWLFDHKGKRYLDMFGGIATVSVGHCHPRITEAIAEQSGILGHVSGAYEHPKMYEYVEALVSKMPGDLKTVYLVNSGSEANELAMQLVRLHTGNQDVLSIQNCYHGVSGNLHGLTALASVKYNNMSAGNFIHHAMCPDVFKGIWGGKKCRDSPVQTQRSCECDRVRCHAADKYYEQLEDIFSYSIPRGKVAGFFAESIQGVGGIVQFPRGYLKRVYELIRSNGGLCVADEVQTGFGRTGEHFWNFQSHGVTPDIVTMAKGIGNGFPMAAVVTTPAIARSLNSGFHFNTFGGNPVSCAVGVSVLKVIDEEGLQKNCLDVGTYFLEKLCGMRREWKIIGDVRGKGLMIGVELIDGDQDDSDKGIINPLNCRAISRIKNDCLKMGLLFGVGGVRSNVLRFMPPMCVTKADVDFTIAVLRRAMQNYYEAKYRNNL